MVFLFFFFFGRTLFQDLSDRTFLIRLDRLIIEKVIEVFADGLLDMACFWNWLSGSNCFAVL